MSVIKNQIIVIPAYEPDHLMVELVEDLRKHFAHIIVVDDSSGEIGFSFFQKIESLPEVILLRHEKNLGKGGALKTAFRYIKENFPEAQSTILCDADGQHIISDILHVAKVSQENPTECIFGVRTFDRKDTPLRSLFGNILTRFILQVLLRISLEDTQTGLRAYPVQYLDIFIHIPYDRYEYDTESIILISKNDWRIRTVHIETVYLDGNRRSHFNPIIDSLKIYWVILKYSLISVFSFLIDVGVFSLLILASFSTFYALFTSRLISAIFNFLAHRHWTFKSTASLKRSVIYYILLWSINVFLGTFLIDIIVRFTHWYKIPTKILVDIFLFFFNFFVSRLFVFPSSSVKTQK